MGSRVYEKAIHVQRKMRMRVRDRETSERKQAPSAAQSHLAAEAQCLSAAGEIRKHVRNEGNDLRGSIMNACIDHETQEIDDERTCTMAPMRDPR